MGIFTYVYIYIYIYRHICVYIYIYIERERCLFKLYIVDMCIYTYTYIYIHICMYICIIVPDVARCRRGPPLEVDGRVQRAVRRPGPLDIASYINCLLVSNILAAHVCITALK